MKGTAGLPFPGPEEDPPIHKYAALFDPRPCLDAIRSAFFWPTQTDAEHTCHLMFEALQHIRDLDPRAK